MSRVRKENSSVRFAQGTTTLPRLKHGYRPELHRQVTERVPVSRLGHVLTQCCQTGLGEALDSVAIAQAKLELSELMEKIVLSLKRNRVGLEMQDPVLLHCFPHWHVTPEKRVVCLLPVHFSKVKVIQKGTGHVLLKIPPIPTLDSQLSRSTQRQNGEVLADVRTKDGAHVSPRKLHAVCSKLVSSALSKRGVGEERVVVSVDPQELTLSVKLGCDWTAELVPCVAAPAAVDSDLFYVTRRFTNEVYEKGDIKWRPCTVVKEHELLHSISSTDGGLRMRAMHVVCRLMSRDWRLAHISCYHVQTALLHDMDFQVDYSPRWQRCALETGVKSLLKTILYFVDRESLPHFDFNPLNLWEGMTSRQMTQARGALNRLLSNENALISLLRRASNDGVSVDFGFLNFN
ncbi:cyclic GMP-AMP synthase-like [Littorina saxatilis]|uniref:Mab-21-like HhH/H2TH-like domain-containing protein n=1 Tax=Littorina saxatilis TaxID=31220 RepID=A0AAN9BCR2_9CAEN